jgi:RHS repeat-associated protein
VYYYLNDHLGTPRKLMNQNGYVYWSADYTPFGEAHITKSNIPNNFRFWGQYYDQETGLHYNYHRYYDPKIGRYLQADPIGQRGGLNLYTYAANDPANGVDPYGLSAPVIVFPEDYDLQRNYLWSRAYSPGPGLDIDTNWFEWRRGKLYECGFRMGFHTPCGDRAKESYYSPNGAGWETGSLSSISKDVTPIETAWLGPAAAAVSAGYGLYKWYNAIQRANATTTEKKWSELVDAVNRGDGETAQRLHRQIYQTGAETAGDLILNAPKP